MENTKKQMTYLVVDGENIDATLGLSVLDRRPNPEERPRWDRVLECAHGRWNQRAKGLFFPCPSYTSDAADDTPRGDFCGRWSTVRKE